MYSELRNYIHYNRISEHKGVDSCQVQETI